MRSVDWIFIVGASVWRSDRFFFCTSVIFRAVSFMRVEKDKSGGRLQGKVAYAESLENQLVHNIDVRN